jgi:hypothetical protein
MTWSRADVGLRWAVGQQKVSTVLYPPFAAPQEYSQLQTTHHSEQANALVLPLQPSPTDISVPDPIDPVLNKRHAIFERVLVIVIGSRVQCKQIPIHKLGISKSGSCHCSEVVSDSHIPVGNQVNGISGIECIPMVLVYLELVTKVV